MRVPPTYGQASSLHLCKFSCVLMLCDTCLRLSNLQVWKGFWDKVDSANLGVIFDVGHGGKSCPSVDPRAPPYALIVISSNGIHHVNVRWCSCSKSLGKASEHWVQLMRTRWFPASHSKPKTAVTFDCLNLFHKLTLQGKLTGHDFYQTLLQLTDNTDIDPPRVSEHVFNERGLFLLILSNI